ncbi:DUF4082 domain-containing protein [Streptosporangium sp. CA-135522]|uniref:DUF4082 domain-containing protein n=1 Tax=Streptosporangium sp. CA-135522 TaxID=3240072 RepID=UPI003D939690
MASFSGPSPTTPPTPDITHSVTLPSVIPSTIPSVIPSTTSPVRATQKNPEAISPAQKQSAQEPSEQKPSIQRSPGQGGKTREARIGHSPPKVNTRKHRAACPPTSVICIENSLPGTPPSQWNVQTPTGNIRGYATQMSVNKGETVQFKVITDATDYRVDIYRVGYYGGMGARLITTIDPSAPLPQTQPACLTDESTGLIDCGNWGVSASWAVPNDAVSGVYLGNLVREDGTSGIAQMIFVIRDDVRNSEILVQTSDATWQAYNTYGGNSLYEGLPVGRAYKVSYNRPFITRTGFFQAEYPMIRWLESNGYDVSYTSNVDTASHGAELLKHESFMSSGHDEYWSNEMRSNIENARDNGVDLMFFSGNEVFWKTRWENSIDGSDVPFRTLVCYKETFANAKIDPSPQWTGTWRDPRFSPPSNGGRPENSVTGTLFMMNSFQTDSIVVPAEYGNMRLWRNTSIASLQPGQSATFPPGTLGYEWDEAPDNGFAPAGLVKFSRTTLSTTAKYMLDFGSTYGAGTATHSLTLYKNPSGSIVFGAGTIQWAWGLDSEHDLVPAGGGRLGAPPPTDIRMQQATVNLLADMGSQPASIQPGLVPTTASTDTSPPTSTIVSPANNGTVPSGGAVVPIQGTASDTGGGVVAAVEVSVDGGTRWFQATGRTNWQYNWTTPATTGTVTIRTRAVDDIGNVQGTPTVTTVTVVTGCPTCTLWSPTTVPAVTSANDPSSVEVGVKFRVAKTGFITGIRFYKGTQNTGTHTGNLWTTSGQLLASATFTSETASGWQQVDFAVPVAISANTTYVASYFTPSGNYAVNSSYFTADFTNGALTAPASSTSGGNGVYRYGATSGFPNKTFQAANYWVDVVFAPLNSLWGNTTTPAQSGADPNAVTVGVKFKATTSGTIQGIRFYKGPQNTGTHIGSLWTSGGQQLASATFTNETASGWQQVNFSIPVVINAGTTYVASYFTSSGNYSVNSSYFTTDYTNGPLTALASSTSGGNGVYRYGATNGFPNKTFQAANYWVDVVFAPSSSLWETATTPAQSAADPNAVTVGVKFKATTSGTIQSIRFYKGPQNTGTHIGSLWTSGGQQLASATFTNETASGWQQVNFSTPVVIDAGTTYVASYFTSSGNYSVNSSYFTTDYTNGALTAPASSTSGGNGVYRYGTTNGFPNKTFQAANYWVDIIFVSS